MTLTDLQLFNAALDVGVQVAGDGDLGHLEDAIAPVADGIAQRNWLVLSTDVE